jgi:bacterioferritin
MHLDDSCGRSRVRPWETDTDRGSMKGDENIIRLLNQLLTNELTAINQYLIQASMCENWGYERLAAKLREDSADERKHADALIERILFLEGVPDMETYNALRVGETVREQLENDLQLEHAVIAFLNEAIAAARDANDNGTESQLELIRQVGEQNYLAQQLRK